MRCQVARSLVTATLLAVAPAVGVAQEAVPPFVPRSPQLAVALSLLGTVVPTTLALSNPEGSGSPWLLLYGVYLGPSTGYFYARRTGRALGGAGFRLGITALAAMGISAACDGDIIWGCQDPAAADAVALVGLGLMGISAISDIVGSGFAARQWNAQHEPPRLSLTPTVDPAARSAGLQVRLAF